MNGIVWVVALLVVVAVILFAVWCCKCNKKRPDSPRRPDPTPTKDIPHNPGSSVSVSIEEIAAATTAAAKKTATSTTPAAAKKAAKPTTPAAVEEATRGARSFPYKELREAAESFKENMIIGEGRFGIVYKAKNNSGYSKNHIDEFVAVRRIIKKEIPDQTLKEILEEIDSASNLSHCNLVQLNGYSLSDNKKVMLIVMEYISNGTLNKKLFPAVSATTSASAVLSWTDRYKIARGLAAAVEYLHSATSVIHGNIKLGNVMLGEGLIPKLGDFGLHRLTRHIKSMDKTPATEIVPELAKGGKASKESDVYSLGIVLLQIGTRRQQLIVEEEGMPLVQWVWKLHSTGKRDILEALGGRLSEPFVKEEEAKRLLVAGLLCCHSDPSQRVDMSQVKALLDGFISLRDLPVVKSNGYK